MNPPRIKVVVFCGSAPNHVALACKLAERFEVVGIVAEKRAGLLAKKPSAGQLAQKALEKLRFQRIDQAWYDLLNFYKDNYPSLPEDVPSLVVENVNSEQVESFCQELAPDLVVVSGTRIVKEPLLSLPLSRGMTNLHTGLSPYVKGGPNCTNWCLVTEQFHLIGNSFMWIDAGIDSGNLIATEVVPFSGEESLYDIHLKVMQAAHDLTLRALRVIEEAPELCPNVPQEEIGKGTLYLTKMWTAAQKARLLRNLPKFRTEVSSPNFQAAYDRIRTVPLPEYDGRLQSSLQNA